MRCVLAAFFVICGISYPPCTAIACLKLLFRVAAFHWFTIFFRTYVVARFCHVYDEMRIARVFVSCFCDHGIVYNVPVFPVAGRPDLVSIRTRVWISTFCYFFSIGDAEQRPCRVPRCHHGCNCAVLRATVSAGAPVCVCAHEQMNIAYV